MAENSGIGWTDHTQNFWWGWIVHDGLLDGEVRQQWPVVEAP